MQDAILQKSKIKTKAKQRYLKRKKERRKSNKKPGSAEISNASDANETPVAHEEAEQLTRPKKRPKLDVEQKQTERSPTPEVSLPQFSLPVPPDAPSKAELALQGLDQALVEAEIVDPSTTLPLQTEDTDDALLSSKSRKRLSDLGITELFAVQTKLLPFLLPKDPLLRALYLPHNPPRDVCVSAPTGSGKTLAYVLPIVEILSARIVTRLRALVVLPTRDLVTQVKETFEAISKGRGLKIGTATGQHSFLHEQTQLVADRDSSLQGGSSKIDILICTPGRLIDHVNETRNFSLQHLRFLVVDEADRLLAQSFQDWLTQVLAAIRPQATEPAASSFNKLPCHDAVAPALLPASHLLGPSYLFEKKQTSCQKLLFSATLTRDPDKIAALRLRDPKYFIVQNISKTQSDQRAPGFLDVAMEKFSIPTTLSEHMIVCDSVKKPLVLFHLIHKRDVTNALVFTKSTESTMRLVSLFEFFENARSSSDAQTAGQSVTLRAYSSDLPANERRVILEKFKAQEIQILVCSDLISRGIDISHVSHVVSYDVPVDMRKYVHRVGRTARAGRSGDAWSLVEEQEARYFKAMLKEADHLDQIKRLRIGEQQLAPWEPYYEAALKQLKEIYAR